jgi:hypothetical protein
MITEGVDVLHNHLPTLCLACRERTPDATIGEQIRASRRAAGLSRRELSERTGFGFTALAWYEAAGGNPPGRIWSTRMADQRARDLVGTLRGFG